MVDEDKKKFFIETQNSQPTISSSKFAQYVMSIQKDQVGTKQPAQARS